MKFTIKHRWTGDVKFETEAAAARKAIEQAVSAKTDLSESDLSGLDLRSANLRYASLRYASLRSANLRSANLSSADLSSADLSSADLSSADLSSADLSYATLMPGGESWRTYCDEVIPALLVAGGKTIEDILATGCWECHAWENCPMHVAFGICDASEGPALLRPRIAEFVQYFDARLLPLSVLSNRPADESLKA